ncbi:intracellular protein transport protein USO1-like [Pieris brassicae]|uniref:intracellular protein transport protein USO1-like n=1 Tax=Pieris brassicae TaxID=7116 RepID=UPI001E6614EE|nr:intracellular protein transport protein USO1-like [Pieris brassicae]
MYSNSKPYESPSLRTNNSAFGIIFQKVQSMFKHPVPENELNLNMSSRASTVASDDSFITPVSSMGDLMTLSPKKSDDLLIDEVDITNDYLTGTDFDSICDVTMREVQNYESNISIDETSLDFLAKCSETSRKHNFIDRGKESLFVKFDPLYAQKKMVESSEGEIQADSLECDIGYETGSTTSILTDTVIETLDNSTSVSNLQSKGFMNKDKPMQMVTPVISSELSRPTPSRTKSTPALVRSVSAILPSPVVTEKLINFSGSTPPVAAPRSPRSRKTTHYGEHENGRLQSLRAILQNQDHEVLQLRQDNRELRSMLQDMEHNFTRYKEEMEVRVKKLTEEKKHFMDKEDQLSQQLQDKQLSNRQMCVVMEEYEKTISDLIGDQQHEKVQLLETLEKITQERDEAVKHLASMESSFNDLLTKYEKCKSVVMESKGREEILNKKIDEYDEGMKKYEELYNTLKQATTDNLQKANEMLENLKKSHNVEITKMNATIKKQEIMISSLQESLAQKTKDNEGLTRICDQLINQVR